MLIVEELFLLLRRTDGKFESGVQAPRLGTTGALLSNLGLRGIAKFDDDAKNPRVRVVDSGGQALTTRSWISG